MSAALKLSKTQLSKIRQSGGLLGALLSKIPELLIEFAVSLAKDILAPGGLMVAASVLEVVVQKKIHGSGVTLVISNKKNE